MSDSFHRSLERALDVPPLPTVPPLSAEEEEELIPAPEMCTAIVYRQTLETPAEYCEEYAVDGEEFCEGHLQQAEPDSWAEPDFDYWGP